MHRIPGRLLGALGTVVVLCLCPGTAEAQSGWYEWDPYLSGWAGAAIPRAEFGTVARNGWHAGAAIGARVGASAVGFRVEGEYGRFELDQARLPGSTRGRTEVLGAGVAATLQLGRDGAVVPYLLVGAGSYRLRVTTTAAAAGTLVDAVSTQTRLGVSAGGGLLVHAGRVAFFAEARVRSVRTPGQATDFFPLSLGLRL